MNNRPISANPAPAKPLEPRHPLLDKADQVEALGEYQEAALYRQVVALHQATARLSHRAGAA